MKRLLIALFLMAASSEAALVVKAWKPPGATRFLLQCIADAVVDLPTCASVNDGFDCRVLATNAAYICDGSGSWTAIGGAGGGDSFKTIDAPAGTDPVADSATDTLTLVCTGATCTGDSATDTLTIAVTGGDPTLAGDVDGLGSANDLDEVNVEAELEGVLDLSDLQGAVTDGQVPDGITVTLAASATSATTATTATTANAGDSATAFFPSGTFEDALVEGSLEADEVNPTLGTQTQGNYVASATASQGLLLTGTEGASLGLIDCAASEALVRNAGDTAWECATVGGGSGLTHPQVMVRLALGGAY